jgi:hypothetical protein
MYKCSATATFSFSTSDHIYHGAYITDPIKLVRVCCESSPFISVGGDYGGGCMKLGFTYKDNNCHSRYVMLCVWNGDDTYKLMYAVKEIKFKYTGDSYLFNNIYNVLQYINNNGVYKYKKVFLNGDTWFIKRVVGMYVFNMMLNEYKSDSDDYDYKDNKDNNRIPLLNINYMLICPLPLHLWLGLGNRMCMQVMCVLLGSSFVSDYIDKVKQKHARGRGGAFGIHNLNGSELDRFTDNMYDVN